jgi:nicotinamide phosphoribosyltransferase
MKANALRDAGGQWRDVAKKPATDPTKGSKIGRQAVIRENGRLVAVRLDAIDPAQDQLK